MKKTLIFTAVFLATLCLPLAGMAQEAQVDRTELPIKGPWMPAIQELDARAVSYTHLTLPTTPYV